MAKPKKADDRPFERVWRLVRKIPRGKVTTYGELSRGIDGRLTPIGVGWAIRAAPEGAIPWQRVVGAGGRIATDNEHPGLQRMILESEGVRFERDGKIDLARFGWAPKAGASPQKAMKGRAVTKNAPKAARKTRGARSRI